MEGEAVIIALIGGYSLDKSKRRIINQLVTQIFLERIGTKKPMAFHHFHKDKVHFLNLRHQALKLS